MEKLTKFTPSKCSCCKQTQEYLLPIDRGTCEILKAIARKIEMKKINLVHLRNELEGVSLTSNQVGNATRPRSHGLIAKVKGHPGNYCLTTKGAQFLRGQPIHKYAIRSKVEDRTVGYWGEEQCTIFEFTPESERWEGIGYDIIAGEVFQTLPTKQKSLF